MKVSVFGTGYVGLVTGVCFAELGHQVICVDQDLIKIEKLRQGTCPIYEPGLEELIQKNLSSKQLLFHSDLESAIHESTYLFIAVGTPMSVDGSADLSAVYDVVRRIGQVIKGYKVIINKSTVPVGTNKKVFNLLKEELNNRNESIDFDVVSNPEFLKEGSAVYDFLNPDRIVLGLENQRSKEAMEELYVSFLKKGDLVLSMDSASAEMTKYAANAMLASRISFMNELSKLCEALGGDIESIRMGIASDLRIGSQFLYPGLGYGGSCFPKDVRALIKMAHEHHLTLPLISSVEQVNQEQRERFYSKIVEFFKGDLSDKLFTLWGLSFKPGTDDVREAPSLFLIHRFIEKGARVKVYDPVAAQAGKAYFQDHPLVRFETDCYESLKDANALCLVTEWDEFQNPHFEKMKSALKEPVIFDGRNVFNPVHMKQLGFYYVSIGRPVDKG